MMGIESFVFRPADVPLDEPVGVPEARVEPVLDFNAPVVDYGFHSRDEKPIDPTAARGSVMGAAFRRENTIGSIMSRKDWGVDNTPEEGYTAWKDIAGTKYEPYWQKFVDSNNSRRTSALKSQIDMELDDERTLQAAGWRGTLAAMTAGVADPTTLLPGGGMVKAIKGGYLVSRSALMVGAAAGAGSLVQEGILQSQQQTRTLEESAIAVGGSVILGALLGSAGAALLNRSERQVAESAARVLYGAEDAAAVGGGRVAAGAAAGSVGAAAVEAPTREALAVEGRGAQAVVDTLGGLTPNTRLMNSPSSAARRYGDMLAETTAYRNMHAEGDTVGPSVETLARVNYNSRIRQSIVDQNELFSAAKKAGAGMTRPQFEEAVGRALRRGDTDENEFVAKAAQAWRRNLFDPFKDEAIEIGLLPPDVKPEGAVSYFSRVYDRPRLIANEADFKGRVTAYYEGELQKEFAQHAEATRARLAELEQEAADLRLSADDRVKTLGDVQARLRDLEARNIDKIERAERVTVLSRTAREAAEKGDRKAAQVAREEAGRLKKEGGKEFADFLKARGKLRSRARRVDLGYAGLEDRQQRVLQQLADLEESNLRGLNRLVARGRKLEQEASRLDPVARDEKMGEFRTAFNQVLKKSETSLQRIADARAKLMEGAKDGKGQRAVANETGVREPAGVVSEAAGGNQGGVRADPRVGTAVPQARFGQQAAWEAPSVRLSAPEIKADLGVDIPGTLLKELRGEPSSVIAWHGSPHDFDRFSLDKIGTGEGAQAYGHGLYFAENEGVARGYRDALQHKAPTNVDGVDGGARYLLQNGIKEARKAPAAEREAAFRQWLDETEQMAAGKYAPPDMAANVAEAKRLLASGEFKPDLSDAGSLYQVRINANPDHFLDWDKPLSEQSPAVLEKLQTIVKSRDRMPKEWIDASPGAEQTMREAGIPGIKYLDAGSRSTGDGTRNFVVFDDKAIQIIGKDGKPVPLNDYLRGQAVGRLEVTPELRADIMPPVGMTSDAAAIMRAAMDGKPATVADLEDAITRAAQDSAPPGMRVKQSSVDELKAAVREAADMAPPTVTRGKDIPTEGGGVLRTYEASPTSGMTVEQLPDGNWAVQDIFIMNKEDRGKGIAQAMYAKALEDGPLVERPELRSAEATRAVDAMIRKGVAERYTDGGKSFLRLKSAEDPTAKFDAMLAREAKAEANRVEKLNSLARRMEALDAFNPEERLYELKRITDEIAREVNDRALAKGEKAAMLKGRYEQFSPDRIKSREDDIARMKVEAERGFYDRWEVKRGGDGVDLYDPKNVKFQSFANDIANAVYDKIMGKDSQGIAAADFLTPLTSGPLKERTFNVPDKLIEDFLDSNVMGVGERYGRSMAAQIEMTKRFGRADMSEQMKEIADEFRTMREAVQNAATREEAYRIVGRDPSMLDGLRAWLRGADEATVTKERILNYLHDAEKANTEDLAAMRDLILGRYNLAESAGDYARMARNVMSFNYIRLMGGSGVVNAISEIYRPAMVHGLKRFMGDGIAPLIRNLDAVKMSVREAQLAGQVTDTVNANRLMTMGEIGDPYKANTAIERILKNGTSFASKWNGLVYWTDAIKSISSVMSQNRIIEGVLGEADDTRFLAMLGIGQKNGMAGRIAEQFRAHGKVVDGVKVANTEAWTDKEAVRTFRAALSKDVDSIIVTRSVGDVPLFANTATGKMILQFRTFNIAAMQRVMMRGMQEEQAKFLTSIVTMSTLGMMAAAFRSWRGGEERWEKFKKSAENPGYLIGEGLDNSGIFTVPFEIANTAEKFLQGGGYDFNPIKKPLVAAFPKASQQGESTRFASRGVLGGLLGPTAGMIETTTKAIGGNANAAAQMIPYGSYAGFRELIQMATGDSPYLR